MKNYLQRIKNTKRMKKDKKEKESLQHWKETKKHSHLWKMDEQLKNKLAKFALIFSFTLYPVLFSNSL